MKKNQFNIGDSVKVAGTTLGENRLAFISAIYCDSLTGLCIRKASREEYQDTKDLPTANEIHYLVIDVDGDEGTFPESALTMNI